MKLFNFLPLTLVIPITLLTNKNLQLKRANLLILGQRNKFINENDENISTINILHQEIEFLEGNQKCHVNRFVDNYECKEMEE